MTSAARTPARNGASRTLAAHPERVLGIDPAAAGATGYAILEADPVRQNEFRVLRYGAVRPARRATPAVRLEGIHRLVAGLIEEFLPGAVAVEAPFAALNIRSALLLAEVRGVVLLAAAQCQVPVESYSPREIKASVAGHGQASKEQIQVMVRSQLRLAELPQPHDAADALAVALCHIHSRRARARMGAALAAPAESRAAASGTGAARAARAR
ncbi:MAG TPA: crossover junction endodeoxyribonuclease RuvC [Candidatus Binatia bacterium]|nr:crossover junction endodeoxyribonuclease RuvC [Candidatus Binatia bacterium]